MNARTLAQVPEAERSDAVPTPQVVRSVDEDRAFGRDLAAQRLNLTRFGQRLCNCPVEAEDLASETMLKAWAARGSFQPGTKLSAWTQFILRNVFLSKMRRGRFSGGSVEDLPMDMLPSCAAPQYAHMDLADAVKAMTMLPRDQRTVMELVGSGATYEEAAEEANCSVGTVKSRVARGRDGLAELLS
jgi:RNA polymerase sigma factor (sigma-70 family)